MTRDASDVTRFADRPAASPGFLLWHVTLAWQRALAAVLVPLGLTHVHFVLLACSWWLSEQGEVPNQLTLARQAGTDIKMTSQVVRKLEAKGLLARKIDPADTRARAGCARPRQASASPSAPSPPSKLRTSASSASKPTRSRPSCNDSSPPSTGRPSRSAESGRLPHCVPTPWRNERGRCSRSCRSWGAYVFSARGWRLPGACPLARGATR